MKKSFCALFALIFGVVMFTSCSGDDEMVGADNAVTNNSADPHVKNGMLVFNNTNQMLTVLGELQGLSDEDFVKSEQDKYKGFTSQRSILISVVDAEVQFNESVEKAVSESEKNALIGKRYSDLYLAKRNSGLLTEAVDANGYTSYDYSIGRPNLVPIVNEDGFFAIGDTIYQVTSAGEKQWIQGDFNRLSALKSASSSDESKGILVDYPMKTKASNSMTNSSELGNHRATHTMNYSTSKLSGLAYIWNYRLTVGFTFEIKNVQLNKWVVTQEATCVSAGREAYMMVSHPQTNIVKEVRTNMDKQGSFNQICGLISKSTWDFDLFSSNYTTSQTGTRQYIEDNLAWNILEFDVQLCKISSYSGGHNHSLDTQYRRP